MFPVQLWDLCPAGTKEDFPALDSFAKNRISRRPALLPVQVWHPLVIFQGVTFSFIIFICIINDEGVMSKTSPNPTNPTGSVLNFGWIFGNLNPWEDQHHPSPVQNGTGRKKQDYIKQESSEHRVRDSSTLDSPCRTSWEGG